MSKKDSKLKIKAKIRAQIFGTVDRPRLTVTRSLNQIYAQLIDDNASATLVAASSLTKELQDDIKNAKGKTAKSKVVGIHLAKMAQAKDISSIVFDRNGYKYHGRVKALADGLREGGLQF